MKCFYILVLDQHTFIMHKFIKLVKKSVNLSVLAKMNFHFLFNFNILYI